jgi:2-dehydro-3-deoxyphosphogluconate aldolase/(4S)-4-hydroxy-2-oxoglutarate aldolase
MTRPLFHPVLSEKISASGVVAVLVVDEARDAVPLARALLAGGVGVMELTLRTPADLDALRAIRRDVPEMTAGIGAILTVDQLHAAREAGAAFGVSPHCNPRLLAAARESGFPFGPGAAQCRLPPRAHLGEPGDRDQPQRT